jgi:uncharacterized phage protein gp47/JayE
MTTPASLTIGPTGVTVPAFADVLAYLQGVYQSIYGSDVVITPDSQDGQWLSVLAQVISDTNNAAAAVYNSFPPSTAQGTGLSSVVKINGLQRQVPTASTVTITIVGQQNTQIINGLVGDNLNLGTQWALPATVTIPGSGTIDVVATCTVLGATAAAANTLTNILTPTAGWQTANNAAIATVGAPVESDAALRMRQAQSTSLSSLTVLDAVLAAVANTTGVQEAAIFENFTETTDANGLPPHSISVVALGGADVDVASSIASKKTPGTTTFGTTKVTVFDAKGIPSTINFYRLTQPPMHVTVTIKALAGFLTTTGTFIQNAILDFINDLNIGETSYLSRLYTPANLSGDAAVVSSGLTQAQLDLLAITFTVTSITQSRDSNALAATDVVFNFYEQGQTILANVIVTVT